MIGAKAIALPLFEFLAPYKRGQPLYLIPERAALLCVAEVIIARDIDTGEEMPVWGTDAYERLEAGEYVLCGPMLVVELSFVKELDALIEVVTAVQGGTDADGDEEDADDLEGEDEDEEADDDEELEDEEDDLDDDWEDVGDDDDDSEVEDDDEDEEGDEDDGIGPI
jgi:hypothetical protein